MTSDRGKTAFTKGLRLFAAALALALCLALPGAADAAQGEPNFVMRMHSAADCIACSMVVTLDAAGKNLAKTGYNLFIAEQLDLILYSVFVVWLCARVAAMVLGHGEGLKDLWEIAKKSALLFLLVMLVKGQGTNVYWEVIHDEPLLMAWKAAGALMGENVSDPTALVAKMETLNYNGAALSWNIMWNFQLIKGQFWQSVGSVLASVVLGTMLVFMFGAALIHYPFFILDILLRVAIISAFAPIFIIFWFLPETRRFTTKALSGLVQSFFTLALCGLVYSLCSTLIAAAIGSWGASGMSLPPERWAETVAAVAAKGQLISPVEPGFWMIFCAALLTSSLSKKIASMMEAIFNFHEGSQGMADRSMKMAQMGTGLLITQTVGTGMAILYPMAMAAPGAARMAAGLVSGTFGGGAGGGASGVLGSLGGEGGGGGPAGILGGLGGGGGGGGSGPGGIPGGFAPGPGGTGPGAGSGSADPFSVSSGSFGLAASPSAASVGSASGLSSIANGIAGLAGAAGASQAGFTATDPRKTFDVAADVILSAANGGSAAARKAENAGLAAATAANIASPGGAATSSVQTGSDAISKLGGKNPTKAAAGGRDASGVFSTAGTYGGFQETVASATRETEPARSAPAMASGDGTGGAAAGKATAGNGSKTPATEVSAGSSAPPRAPKTNFGSGETAGATEIGREAPREKSARGIFESSAGDQAAFGEERTQDETKKTNDRNAESGSFSVSETESVRAIPNERTFEAAPNARSEQTPREREKEGISDFFSDGGRVAATDETSRSFEERERSPSVPEERKARESDSPEERPASVEHRREGGKLAEKTIEDQLSPREEPTAGERTEQPMSRDETRRDGFFREEEPRRTEEPIARETTERSPGGSDESRERGAGASSDERRGTEPSLREIESRNEERPETIERKRTDGFGSRSNERQADERKETPPMEWRDRPNETSPNLDAGPKWFDDGEKAKGPATGNLNMWNLLKGGLGKPGANARTPRDLRAAIEGAPNMEFKEETLGLERDDAGKEDGRTNETPPAEGPPIDGDDEERVRTK